MKWVRYTLPGATPAEPRIGVLVDDLVHGGDDGDTLLNHLRAGDLHEEGRRLLADPVERHPLTAATLAPPIETPPSIRDFMVFEQHVEGMGRLAGARPAVPEVWYRQPLYYFSNPAGLLGPFDDVAGPPGSEVLDFELEVAAIIAATPGLDTLSDLTIAEAERCIVGYALMNDWTARDLQALEMQGPLGPCKGKDFATSLGPWLLTADELPGLASGAGCDVTLTATIDGTVFGQDNVANMAWSFAEMVAYASRGTRLQPGDVIGSGTCGSGCIAEIWGRRGRNGRAPLQPGSTLQLNAGPLGTQVTRIAAGTPVRQPLRDRRSVCAG